MDLGFDLSVKNYSLDDIFILLGLDSNPTIPEVNNKLNIFINMFSDITSDNSVAIINFFQEIGERLNQELFNNLIIKSDSDLNYFNNNVNESDNYMSQSVVNSIGDNINPTDLIMCDNTEKFIDEMKTTRDIIDSNPNFIEKNYNYEFTIPDNLLYDTTCSIQTERTFFKYEFPNIVTNVNNICLASIKVKLPYTISEYRKNNKFTIIDNSNNINYSIDVSYDYIISNASLIQYIEYINDNYFLNVDNSNNILGNIQLSIINSNASKYKIRFDLLNITGIYTTFSLIFDQSAVISEYYLNNILGLDPTYYNATSVISNPIETSIPYIYFSVNDNTINYSQNLNIPNSSLKGKNILNRIDITNNDIISNNYIIINNYNDNDLMRNTRDYNGFINLTNFTIRFYDSHGILQQIPKEDFNNNNFNFTFRITQLIADINSV